MKTKLIIEIESKDKLMAYDDSDLKKPVNIAEDFHEEVIYNIKRLIEEWIANFPEGIEDSYIEQYDDVSSYGLKIKIKTQHNAKERL